MAGPSIPAPPTVLQPMPVPEGFPLAPGVNAEDVFILAMTPQALPPYCLFVHDDGTLLVRVAVPAWLKDIQRKLQVSINTQQTIGQEVLKAVAQVLEVSLVVRRDCVSDDVRRHVEAIDRRIAAEHKEQRERDALAQASIDAALQAHKMVGDNVIPPTPGQAPRVGDGPGQPDGGPRTIGRIILPGGGGGAGVV